MTTPESCSTNHDNLWGVVVTADGDGWVVDTWSKIPHSLTGGSYSFPTSTGESAAAVAESYLGGKLDFSRASTLRHPTPVGEAGEDHSHTNRVLVQRTLTHDPRWWHAKPQTITGWIWLDHFVFGSILLKTMHTHTFVRTVQVGGVDHPVTFLIYQVSSTRKRWPFKPFTVRIGVVMATPPFVFGQGQVFTASSAILWDPGDEDVFLSAIAEALSLEE